MASSRSSSLEVESPTGPNRWLALRICALGIFVNCQPSEPYLTSYLLETKNLTEAQLESEVYPWSTTGGFLFLLPLALLAEVAGSRTVILLGLLCREATRVLLLYAEGVAWMRAMQLAYAGGVAVNAIYFAYVYTVVPGGQYTLYTSLVLAGYHVGNVCGALLAQLLVDCVPGVRANLGILFYLSWGFTSLGAAAFVLLPAPSRVPPPALAATLLRHGPRATCREAAALLSPLEVQRWLPWWLLGYSAQAIAENYFQLQLSRESGQIHTPASCPCHTRGSHERSRG
jgi:MFS family permease